MKTIEKPFWEESYKRPGRLDTFGGGKPSQDVVSIASKMDKGLTALDIGCGEGRNAIFLAEYGFKTTAIDVSVSGIEKLNSYATKLGIAVDTSVCDMREFKFNKVYDLIVCHGCLHLVHKNEWQEILRKMQGATSNGGYHIVNVFTDDAPEPEDQRGLMVGMFKDGELYQYYNDWEIIEKNAYSFEDQHPDGQKHKHAGNRIIARKK